MGRHLMELGIEPGPNYSYILKTMYEAQIDEKFRTLDEGKEYLRGYLNGT